jgi:MFS family permease
MIHSYVKFFRGEWPVLLFGVACAFLSSPGQTFFISMFVRSITDSIGVSAGTIGLLYLAATLGSASLLPLTGHWLDRLDLRFYTMAVMSGLAAACGIMASASGMVSLFLGLLLLRLTGQGLMTHIAVVSVARYFEGYRGRALSFVALGLPLAEAAMPQLALLLIASVGWRMGYAFIAIFVFLIAAPGLVGLIWRSPSFTHSGSKERNPEPPRVLDGMKIVTATRFFWFALPVLLFMPFASTALIFHIREIAAVKGWTDAMIGTGFLAYAIGHGIGLFISGEFIDRFRARSMLVTMNLPFLVGIAALGTFASAWTLPAFLALTGLSSGFVQTTVAAVWAEVFGVSKLGTVRSFATMVTVAGTAAGPAAVGLLLDRGISIGSLASLFITYGVASGLLVAIEVRSRHVTR